MIRDLGGVRIAAPPIGAHDVAGPTLPSLQNVIARYWSWDKKSESRHNLNCGLFQVDQ